MGSLETSAPPLLYYFCDETSHEPGHKFMAAGGIAVAAHRIPEIKKELADIRERRGSGLNSEIKWAKTPSSHESAEKDYARCLARLVGEKKVHLHILFADFKNFLHRASGPLRRTDSTGKMHFQLILHKPLQYYGATSRIHIRPDGGDCTKKLVSMKDKLLGQGWRRYRAKTRCIASIEQADSSREPMLQLLDVTLGAFAALKNERHKDPAQRQGKKDLALLVDELYGRPDLSIESDKKERVFSLWNFAGKPPEAELPGIGW